MTLILVLASIYFWQFVAIVWLVKTLLRAVAYIKATNDDLDRTIEIAKSMNGTLDR